jgi:hypothetical protein
MMMRTGSFIALILWLVCAAFSGLAQHGPSPRDAIHDTKYPNLAQEVGETLLPGTNSPHTNSEAGVACDDSSIDVFSIHTDERNLICEGASHAVRSLEQCGLEVRHRVRVTTVDRVRSPFGAAGIAAFDAPSGEVAMTRLISVTPLVRGTPYERIPWRELYMSFAAHEVVHAILSNHFQRQPTMLAAYEYPAYALQLSLWSSTARLDFIKSILGSTGEIEMHKFFFTDELLLINPYFFAVRAYQHFNAPGNGCNSLLSLVAGSAQFLLNMPQHGSAPFASESR